MDFITKIDIENLNNNNVKKLLDLNDVIIFENGFVKIKKITEKLIFDFGNINIIITTNGLIFDEKKISAYIINAEKKIINFIRLIIKLIVENEFDKIIKILILKMDINTSDKFFKVTEKINPELFKILSSYLIKFEDIINYGKLALDSLIRDIGFEIFAIASIGLNNEQLEKLKLSLSKNRKIELDKEMELNSDIDITIIQKYRNQIRQRVNEFEIIGYEIEGKI